ncbi:neuroendocrine convertase 2-like [Ruditapes philippinarum]|uniref:neuroendocrine convertase 2-like n=1 Tax=Ruditapes philippinarum TaxID=129788 RepID=UPI00295BE3FA|nr:neuroendocrine convertase 2-like [Ruditapes philippinarum]
MGVQKVWAKNITGKGVKIAIIGAGINTDLKDLKRNIGDCELCKNFIQNSTDVAPESFKDLLDKPPSVADHGNKVASIVAAEKDNNICSAGIAYDATIIG